MGALLMWVAAAFNGARAELRQVTRFALGLAILAPDHVSISRSTDGLSGHPWPPGTLRLRMAIDDLYGDLCPEMTTSHTQRRPHLPTAT